MSDKKLKNEVSRFRKKYIYNNSEVYIKSLSDGCAIENIIKIFNQCKDFERPDGYYFDQESLTLYIFEHFEFDCSPRIGLGSSLRRNSKVVNETIKQEIESSNGEYYSTKAIVQGYSNEDDDTTFVMGANGDKYRDNYVEHFEKAYKDHAAKVQKYIENSQKEIGIEPKKVVISFLIEDVTVFGTYYKEGDSIGNPVVLTYTQQFLKVFRNSKIDYVFFGSSDNRYLIICDRSIVGDDLNQYIDLQKKEFYVMPVAPVITAAKKL